MIADAEQTGGKTTEDVIDDIMRLLGCTEELTRDFIRFTLENIQLFDRKQHDYGARNIAGYGTFGVIVRMSDKHARLQSLFHKKRRPRVQESIDDSLKDISNYSTIARMVERKVWPQ